MIRQTDKILNIAEAVSITNETEFSRPFDEWYFIWYHLTYADEASAYPGECVQDTHADRYPVDGHCFHAGGGGRGGLSTVRLARASEEGSGADGCSPAAP